MVKESKKESEEGSGDNDNRKSFPSSSRGLNIKGKDEKENIRKNSKNNSKG